MSVSTASASVSTQNTQRRMNEIHSRSNSPTPEEELARQIVPKLAARSYHLPGYNIAQDWMQYMLNNHPLLGVCCRHRLHPIKTRQRIIILLGSFAYGVAITNAIYLWFLGSGRDDKEEVFSVNMSLNNSSSQTVSLTSGLIVLVTVGSGSHSMFDRFIWTLAACSCCRSGGVFESRGCLRDFGYYLVILLVTAVLALASCVVVIRASMEEGETTVPLFQNRTREDFADLLDFDEFAMEDYSFLRGYALEFAVSLFVYYPLFETILFSGILGCCGVPILGGRPYAMKKEAKAVMKSRSRSATPQTDIHMA